MFFNLLSNACKFTQDGLVTVTLENFFIDTKDENHQRWIRISVTDTGIGMTEDQPEIPKGGGGYVYLIKDSDYTANKQEHIFVDTSIPNLIMTLPSNPTLGDTVIVADMTGNAITNNVTIGRGNKTIMGLAEDFILDVSSSEVKFTYSNEANGWRVS